MDAEHKTAAQITARQFVSHYHQVSGCSGTALAGKQEFAKVYRLDVQRIPERLPCRRSILAPQFFANQAAKWKAIEAEVIAVHQQQRPVLVGTRSIAQSHQLAEQLRSAGLKVQLLNGTQNHVEADVIAQAGQRATITVATDMAGRGTDIPIDLQVALLGGLHVIVSELSLSPRIDRQLIVAPRDKVNLVPLACSLLRMTSWFASMHRHSSASSSVDLNPARFDVGVGRGVAR